MSRICGDWLSIIVYKHSIAFSKYIITSCERNLVEAVHLLAHARLFTLARHQYWRTGNVLSVHFFSQDEINVSAFPSLRQPGSLQPLCVYIHMCVYVERERKKKRERGDERNRREEEKKKREGKWEISIYITAVSTVASEWNHAWASPLQWTIHWAPLSLRHASIHHAGIPLFRQNAGRFFLSLFFLVSSLTRDAFTIVSPNESAAKRIRCRNVLHFPLQDQADYASSLPTKKYSRTPLQGIKHHPMQNVPLVRAWMN